MGSFGGWSSGHMISICRVDITVVLSFYLSRKFYLFTQQCIPHDDIICMDVEKFGPA